jgi:nondiscriminating glutamyl-tRNA synthetase
MLNNQIRVRFAPSPTGFLHVGGARTALFNWLFARHSGGTFILRIEDTDRERSRPEYEEAILRDMRWLGLDWDEGPVTGGASGPYFQTQRRSLYQEQLQKLLSTGSAYHCFCTPEELAADRESQAAAGKIYRYSGKCSRLTADEADQKLKNGELSAIRLKVKEGVTTFTDRVRGQVTVNHDEIDDLVLVRRDGEPTYNFVAVVDDALMEISHVIRGDDHLPNTPKQILVYNALGFKIPQFAHIPLILGPDRSPLSKRHGASSVSEFKRQGYLPETMVNYLALLGWSFDGKTEIFSREELVGKFSLDRVVKSAASFDYEKLQWLNGHYLRAVDDEKMFQLCRDHLLENEIISPEYAQTQEAYLRRAINLVRGNLKLISEIGEQLTYFLNDVYDYDPQALVKFKTIENAPVFEQAVKVLKTADSLAPAPLEERFRKEAVEMGRKFGELVHPMRLAITGRTHSPNLFEIMEVLGKERCIDRLNRFLNSIQSTAV